jgi:hypothetical protein
MPEEGAISLPGLRTGTEPKTEKTVIWVGTKTETEPKKISVYFGSIHVQSLWSP